MDNQFESKGGGQNVGQGDHAIGQQENATQEVRGNGSIFSGTGNVTVNQSLRLRPRTVVLASVLAAAVLVAGLAGWHWLAPPAPPGKNVSTTGNNAPAIIAEKGNVAVTYNTSSVPPEVFAKYAGELAVTDSALASFFKILEEQQVPHSDLDSKLREIAANYKELLQRMEAVQSEDPQVVKLKEQARQAIEAGDYAKAEELLNQAEARDVQAFEQLEEAAKRDMDAAKQRRISAADTNVTQALAQRVQLRHAKAAAYWQKAAALLPDDKKKERSLYLHSAAFDLDRIAKYKEALPLYEQSLAIRQEIGDKAGEGETLNNISQIYHDRGDYATALKYLEQSLAIMQEIGYKAGEGVTLNNISQIYSARGDRTTALKYLEQNLVLFREIGDRAGEGGTLNNISQIYHDRGDYTTALKYLEQSLAIRQEIGDKAGEGATLNNISQIYDARGDYATALKYLEQSLRITQELGDKKVEGTTLNNIGGIYNARGDYATALKYYEQSLRIRQEIGDKAGEAVTLNNIATTAYAKGDYTTALKYLEQSHAIRQEISDKEGEAVTSWNIGLTYAEQGELAKAEQYISRAVQLAEELGHPKLEEWRKTLETLRVKLRGR